MDNNSDNAYDVRTWDRYPQALAIMQRFVKDRLSATPASEGPKLAFRIDYVPSSYMCHYMTGGMCLADEDWIETVQRQRISSEPSVRRAFALAICEDVQKWLKTTADLASDIVAFDGVLKFYVIQLTVTREKQ